jgi:dipeptidyl aminopeptidase/acylaminoacyl peptidase
VRDVATGEETQLTTDGTEFYGYATNNAGWTKSDRPILEWSPDSKKIATFRHDGRGVGKMYLVRAEPGHPELEEWLYPMPEDSVIFRIERLVAHVDEPKIVWLDMPPDQHRSTITDHIAYQGGWADIDWSDDSSELAFVSSSRNHKDAWLRVADPETGAVTDVMHEHQNTFFESGLDDINWRFLPESDAFLWWSQRDNWGHLYFVNRYTGQIDHQVTSGSWNVSSLVRVDEDARQIWFMGQGREAGDPYFKYLYRVNFDGSGLTLLSPERGTHSISFSPEWDYFVDMYSQPDVPPVTELRTADGELVMSLEKADISDLEAAGWQPPTPFSVKARDGETDLFGLMYTPTDLDESASYPVLNYIYPGPQTGSVGSRAFRPSRSDKQAIAELGFVVVEMDGMGTPGRSKSFHDTYYGNMGDNTLPDQITGIRQLADRHPYMDLDRVGIWGHSGGGFATVAAMFRYPDFYKVGVSGSGNHDNRVYEDDWGEKWQGLLVEYEDGTTNYDNQANQLVAGNLKGKLLIAHGAMDSNVPPYNTYLVVEALMNANKDFDMLIFPSSRHGYRQGNYWMRRRWDYFVRNLLGKEPPHEYEIGGD